MTEEQESQNKKPAKVLKDISIGICDPKTGKMIASDIELKEIIDREVAEHLVAIREEFSGPIPHPKHMKEYKNIDKTLPSRILGMAESNLDHMQSMERKTTYSEIGLSYLSWAASTGLTVYIITIAKDLLMQGKGIESLGAFLASLTPLAATFLLRKFIK